VVELGEKAGYSSRTFLGSHELLVAYCNPLVSYPVRVGGKGVGPAGSMWRTIGSWYTVLRVPISNENWSNLTRSEKSLLVMTNWTASNMAPVQKCDVFE